MKVWIRTLLRNLFSSAQKALPQSREGRSRLPHFTQFIEKNIATTRSVHGYSPKLVSEYQLEAVVSGSDQVWRPRYNRQSLTNMFLDFVKDGSGVKKIAYAASFGVDSWEYRAGKARKCRKYAKRLDAISVREESGVALCNNHLRVEAIEVLDPTLLLSAEEYQKVCAAVPKSEERFVAAYILDASPEKVALVEQEAAKRGVACRIYSAGEEAKLSIEEWLAIFRDAESVVTDSFHGSVFSIIFQKEFISIINRNRGASRFVSLLGKFGLLDRIVIDATRAVLPSQPVDWDNVKQQLQVWQEKSLNYLNSALCR